MSFSSSRIIAGVMNWGTWGANLSTPAIAKLIDECVDLGISTFDNADIYGDHTTESEWGKGLALADTQRESIKIITKCGIMMPSAARPKISAKHYDTSASHITASVEQSLTNLQTDYIDLLLIHRPSPLTDYAEVAETILKLRAQGKIIEFGVSNFSPSQVELLRKYIPVSANQIEVSPICTAPFTDGSLDHCMLHGIAPQAWSPLGGGRLFGTMSNPVELQRRNRFLSVCKKYDWSLDQMSYLFLLHHPANIQLVVGSSKISRIRKASDALETRITDAQWFEIYTAAIGSEVP